MIPEKASTADFAEDTESALITPVPCVPSSNFKITGVPPTSFIKSFTSSDYGCRANNDFGIPTPDFERI